MERKQFGKLLVSLREQFDKGAEGQGLTRQALSERTSLSVPVLGRLERGELVNLDPEMLEQVALALRLTIVEFHELLALSVDKSGLTELTSAKSSSPCASQPALPELFKQLIFPAVLRDDLHRIYAVNCSFLALLGITAAFLQNHLPIPSQLHIFYHPNSPTRALYADAWEEIAVQVCHQWRLNALRWRTPPNMDRLLALGVQLADEHEAELDALVEMLLPAKEPIPA